MKVSKLTRKYSITSSKSVQRRSSKTVLINLQSKNKGFTKSSIYYILRKNWNLLLVPSLNLFSNWSRLNMMQLISFKSFLFRLLRNQNSSFRNMKMIYGKLWFNWLWVYIWKGLFFRNGLKRWYLNLWKNA